MNIKCREKNDKTSMINLCVLEKLRRARN